MTLCSYGYKLHRENILFFCRSQDGNKEKNIVGWVSNPTPIEKFNFFREQSGQMREGAEDSRNYLSILLDILLSTHRSAVGLCGYIK